MKTWALEIVVVLIFKDYKMNEAPTSCHLQTYAMWILTIPITKENKIWQYQFTMVNNFLTKNLHLVMHGMTMATSILKQTSFSHQVLNY